MFFAMVAGSIGYVETISSSRELTKFRHGNKLSEKWGVKMLKTIIGVVLATALLGLPARAGDYFPPKGDAWAAHTPAQEHLDAAKLKAAINFAISAERKYPPELAKAVNIRDLRVSVPLEYAGEAYNSPIGPLKPHAPPNGIIIRHGYIVAEWGLTKDVDMTFSVTKTFLSSVAGVAFDKGMIKSVNDRVIDYVKPSPDFLNPHNVPITWDNMLRQDLRLDQHHVGQALVGRPARSRKALERTRKRSAAGRHGMEIQRRAGECAGAGPHSSVETAAARCAQAICRRSHRHVG